MMVPASSPGNWIERLSQKFESINLEVGATLLGI